MMIGKNFQVNIYGIADRSSCFPKEILNTPKSYLSFFEIPTTQEKAYEIFKLLNDRKQDYFSSKELYIKKVNGHLREYFGFGINEMVLGLMHTLKDNYKRAYAVGCLDNFEKLNIEELKIDGIENKMRVERSIRITQTCEQILNTFEKTIEAKMESTESLFQMLNNESFLEENYVHGKKMKFLNEILQNYFDNLGSIEYLPGPSIAKSVFDEMTSIKFDIGKKSESKKGFFVNPSTFDKSYYEAKNSSMPKNVNIFVGENHRLFIGHFLGKKYNVSSQSFAGDYYKQFEGIIRKEIMLVEKHNLISVY